MTYNDGPVHGASVLHSPGSNRVSYIVPNNRFQILLNIHQERLHQEEVHPQDSVEHAHRVDLQPTPLSHLAAALGEVARSQNDDIYGPTPTPLSILLEEVGEVATVLNGEGGDLYDELLQVAAVAVAWIEVLLKEKHHD